MTSPQNIDKAFPIHCRDVPWAIILRVTDTKNEQVDNSCQVERKLQRSMISLLSRSNARAGLEEGVNDVQPPADLIDAEEGTSLPQEPAVVVDTAVIGLHSRLASKCRINICCRLSKFSVNKADRLRSRVRGRARGEKKSACQEIHRKEKLSFSSLGLAQQHQESKFHITGDLRKNMTYPAQNPLSKTSEI